MKSQPKKKRNLSIGAVKLRTWREGHEMTLENVAQRLDVTKQAISYWELGDTLPRIYHMRELVVIADIAFMDWLKEA